MAKIVPHLYWIDIDNKTTGGRAEQIAEALNSGIKEMLCCKIFRISRPTLEHIIHNPSYEVLSETARRFNSIAREKERMAIMRVMAKMNEVRKSAKNAKL